MPWYFSRLGLALCDDVSLDHFGLSRCSVTFKPLLFVVTVLYGKSLGPYREKTEKYCWRVFLASAWRRRQPKL
jgi:hypothetical protein